MAISNAARLGALFAATVLGSALLHPAQARADEAACRSLTAAGLFPDTAVTSAEMVAADAASGAPAFCEVKGVLSPNARSKIAVVYRLPDGWNGRVLGIGGGGWAGNVTLQAARPGLSRGYATLQTNGGHDNAAVFDTSWAKDNPEAVTDFSHRALHLTTVVGKQVVARYYGRPLDLAVFQGCSTGGRMGLMEAQRYPQDYAAIIAGAPVFTLQVQTSSIVRGRLFTTPQTGLSEAQVALVHRAVLDACDGLDGLKDGVITDPRACRWDPLPLQCRRGEPASDACLTTLQAGALRQAYATLRGADGQIVQYGLSRGGEADWGAFIPLRPAAAAGSGAAGGGLGALRRYMFGEDDYDLARFDPARDAAAVRATPFAKEYEAADPDLRPFLSRGGKLLLWHGLNDPAPSPYATAAYYEEARRIAGPDAAIRLFLAPGVNHCGGGPGAHSFDMLAAMEGWIARGEPPATIPAANPERGLARPLCPWPALPFYRGEGDANAPESFACRATPPMRTVQR